MADTTVDYVMYKLSSTIVNSKTVEKKDFTALNSYQGILTFGPVVYSLGRRDSNSHCDVGAIYLLSCEQQNQDVVLKIKFYGYSGIDLGYSTRHKTPTFVLNQAYHRFFKEQFQIKGIINVSNCGYAPAGACAR